MEKKSLAHNNPAPPAEQARFMGSQGDASGFVRTGVGAIFSASHFDEVRQETHGHSYEVVAWFQDERPRDAVVLQLMLQTILKTWDHKVLPPELSRAESLASAILGLMSGCVEVEVNRPLERLYARVRAW